MLPHAFMEAHWGPHLVAEGLGAVDVTGGRGVIIILHALARVRGFSGTVSRENLTLQGKDTSALNSRLGYTGQPQPRQHAASTT